MSSLRLDRFLTACGAASRKEAASSVRRGEVKVDGVAVTDPAVKLDPERSSVFFRGEMLAYREHYYVMLNKPEGYVSATEDKHLPYVLSLLSPLHQSRGLFPVGRLDRDTVGLLFMTDDGDLAHRLLSPRRGVEKVYRFCCESSLTPSDIAKFAEGMTLSSGESFRPAILSPDKGGLSGTVILTEGKYHEVKRMFLAVGNKITALERVSFAGIALDPTLKRGEYRDITEAELARLREAAT